LHDGAHLQKLDIHVENFVDEAWFEFGALDFPDGIWFSIETNAHNRIVKLWFGH
jgi:hypothetical protein